MGEGRGWVTAGGGGHGPAITHLPLPSRVLSITVQETHIHTSDLTRPGEDTSSSHPDTLQSHWTREMSVTLPASLLTHPFLGADSSVLPVDGALHPFIDHSSCTEEIHGQ